jgi:hypothetical protein
MEWIELNLVWGRGWWADDCFVKRGLNKPGVLVEFEDGEQMLIGTVSPELGVCNCCEVGVDDRIVKRYKVLWENPNSVEAES